MARNDATAAIIDRLLKLVSVGAITASIIVVPNAIWAMDKPLQRLLENLDRREQERQLKYVFAYMKRQGLIRQTADDYVHGLELTNAGKTRLRKYDYSSLEIPIPSEWDGRWRLVFFDIPERLHTTRKVLTSKLRLLGFQQLQQSIWIYPFPCRSVIEAVSEHLGVSRYITHVEINEINNSSKLVARFSSLLE